MNPRDFDRERSLFQRLDDWPVDVGIVIGGYAAATLSIPRFSVDMDIVVSSDEHPRATMFLQERGFTLTKTSPVLDQNYGGFVERWDVGDPPVAVDLLVDSVQDREFQIPFSYEVLAQRAKTMQVRGSVVSGFSARVVSPEALIALKVMPMRARDVGDICCLSPLGLDLDQVKRHMRRLYEDRGDLTRERLGRMEALLGATDEAAAKALGPRVPGPQARRLQVAKSSRRLLRTLQSWAA